MAEAEALGSVEAVVFDWGGTLTPWHEAEPLLRRLCEDGIRVGIRAGKGSPPLDRFPAARRGAQAQ